MGRVARVLAVVAVAALAVPAAPGAARADSGLTGSDPAAGAALAAAPAAVELTFAGEPDPADSHVTVLDAGAAAVSTGEPRRVDRRTLRQPVAAGLTGDLTVAWHVAFRDGGQSRGTLRFSVGTGRPPPPAGPALDRATAELLDTHTHRIDPLSAVLLLVNAVVVLGAVTLLAVRDPRRPRAWRLPAEFGGPPTSRPGAEPGDPGPAQLDSRTTGRGTT
ncbi:copper resistance CopC family protein [Micromonospora thermarum]|uniref:Copper resistance protein CopC n=1 Tax=Micromonospora thermarum TaxID=2720024 RepID=A0ABX0ZC17_9ACTN|nr:copper resistance protein CopC [Micromonospora thermarum]NJP33636.1 copper resistance protein CopC [Micromonospora thermarum]